MQIIRASEMGFCFGVRRAIDMMEQAAQEHERIDSLGSVVHNPKVVEGLAGRGVHVAAGLGDATGQTLAITAHGAGPQIIEDIKAQGKSVIDTTCPIVERSQLAAKRLVDDGFIPVVYGDENHPEVRGVLAWTDGKGLATTDPDFLKGYKRPPKRIGLLAQTTQVPEHFAEFVSHILHQAMEEVAEVRVINTLCGATTKQQHAALELAYEVDLMIVVGGRKSANTTHLAELCADAGVETHHIETAEEIDPRWLGGRERVGITAGASTPDDSIEAVAARIEELSLELERGSSSS